MCALVFISLSKRDIVHKSYTIMERSANLIPLLTPLRCFNVLGKLRTPKHMSSQDLSNIFFNTLDGDKALEPETDHFWNSCFHEETKNRKPEVK